jgi:hypothetical protein
MSEHERASLQFVFMVESSVVQEQLSFSVLNGQDGSARSICAVKCLLELYIQRTATTKGK